MSRSRLPFLVTWLIALACSSPSNAPRDAPAGELSQVAWAAALELKPPAAELAQLEALVGDWQVLLEDLSGGQARGIASGTASIRSRLGGRYLAWDVRLEFEGQSVRAEGRLGFDATLDLFQFLWLSELSPGMRIANGRGDPRHGGLLLELAERDLVSGALVRARSVLRIADEDHFSLTQLGLDEEQSDWIELQRTRYTRRVPSAAAQEASRDD